MTISKWVSIVGILCFCMFVCSNTGSAIQTNNHMVTINAIEEELVMKETLTMDSGGDALNKVMFWLPSDATQIQLFIGSDELTYQKTSDHLYECNLSAYQSNQTIKISINYFLPKATDTYEKQIQYNTTSFTLQFDTSKLYTGSNLSYNSMVQISITAAEETASLINIYIIILIVLLVVLLVVSVVYGMKKKHRSQDRIRSLETTEVLSVEKTLLMDMLKQIEKLHRTNKISDETYQKLKSHYKQQTVEIMSNLDDQEPTSKK